VRSGLAREEAKMSNIFKWGWQGNGADSANVSGKGNTVKDPRLDKST
tara:strand:- start:380 stop:520 length:141 start_codon:yes stop_codon:yes gene_type:complete